MTIGYAIILMASFFTISFLMGTLTRLLTSDFESKLAKLVMFLMISFF